MRETFQWHKNKEANRAKIYSESIGCHTRKINVGRTAGQQWGGGGATVRLGFLAARAPYGLNNVQRWGLGEMKCEGAEVGGGGGIVEGGGGGQPLRTALYTISISLLNSLWIAYLETSELESSKSNSGPLGAICLARFCGRKVKWVRQKTSQTKNRIKRITGLILLQTSYEGN